MYECYVASGGRGSIMTKDIAEFTALIKKITIKSLASLDKGCQLLLELNGNDTELLTKLVMLHKADEEVKVRIE